MAITVNDNFSYQGKLSNFERDSFDTLESMKSFPETSLDDGHISYCKEDGNTYRYNSNNEINEITGKWRTFTGLTTRHITFDGNLTTYSIPENTSETDEVVYYITTGNDISGCNIDLASENMKWCNGVSITLSPNKTYVVSVLYNMVAWGEF